MGAAPSCPRGLHRVTHEKDGRRMSESRVAFGIEIGVAVDIGISFLASIPIPTPMVGGRSNYFRNSHSGTSL